MSKSKKSGPATRVPKSLYEKELERLQADLVGMQHWVSETGARVLVIFEGRDAAGKGGAIKRIVQYLNPRSARVVALPEYWPPREPRVVRVKVSARIHESCRSEP